MYEIIVPKSKILKRHIYNFCVLKKFDGKINYLAFPQLGNSMAFYTHSDIKIEGRRIVISKTKGFNPKVLLLGKYKLPIQIEYDNFSPEISINFTPTGINHFFEENTSQIASKIAQKINNNKFQKVVSQIRHHKCNSKTIQILEKFLLDNFVEKNLSVIENGISLLERNPDIKVSEIASTINISVRTLNRWCSIYLGCSPTDFRKIVRFRKAIDTKFNNPIQSLTQICFESYFYDSPHFTREFKKLTHMNPKTFFSQTVPVSNQKIPYKFL